MSISEFIVEDAGGYPVAQVEPFITEMNESAAAALAPAIRTAGDPRVIAVTLKNTFAAVGDAFTAMLAKRRELQRQASFAQDTVLRQMWDDYAEQTQADVSALEQTISTKEDELRVALAAEAIPTSDDPSAILVARQEIELLLSIGSDSSILTLISQADRGGDIAAVASSEWARLTLVAAGNSDDGFDQVKAAAVRAAVESEDPAESAAAKALQALDAIAPGQVRVPALANACACKAFVAAVIYEALTHGIVLA